MSYRDTTMNDVLAAVGLQRHKAPIDYVLPALGIFGAGLLVGAGVGLMFAPKRGEELRHDMSERLRLSRREAQVAAHQH